MPRLIQQIPMSLLFAGRCFIAGLIIIGVGACDTQLQKPFAVPPSGVCTTNDQCSGEQICELGECRDDPCQGITCDEVPAASCNGNHTLTYAAGGECRGGACFYQPTSTDCGDDVCVDGVCVADPCRDVVCTTPPAAICESNSVITFVGEGVCSDGNCIYAQVVTPCEAGRQCVNANCELACNCSALQSCDEATGTCVEPSVCLSDVDCNGLRVCVLGECTDEIPECRTNAECVDGYCVSRLLECEATVCTQNSDCTSESYCNTDNGYCVECLEDSHCNGAQTCNFNVCEEPTTCTAAIDCLGHKVCEGGSCVEEVCDTDDAFDLSASNDFFEGASELTVTNGSTGSQSLRICNFGDDEWFELDQADIQQNDGLVVAANFPASSGRVELFITRGDEFSQELVRGGSNDGQFVVSVANVPAPPFFLRFHATAGTLIDLEFEVKVYDGGLCLDSDGEPNNNSSGATDIGSNPVSEGRPFVLCKNSHDEDWFKFSADAGKEIEVRIAADTTSVAGIELYHGGQGVTTLLNKDITQSANKLLTHTSQGGLYFVRIYSDNSSHERMAGAVSVTTN